MQLLRFSIVAGLALFGEVHAGVLEDFHTTLDEARDRFHIRYGMEEYKQSRFGWTIDSELATIRAKGDKLGTALGLMEAQRLVLEFFQSTRDFHVGVYTGDWTGADLPIRVALNGNRAFVVAVLNPVLAPEFAVGDEILAMDGKTFRQQVDEVQVPNRYSAQSRYETLFASRYTIKRYKALLIDQPTRETVTFRVRPTGTRRAVTRELKWLVPKPSVAPVQVESMPAYRNIPRVFQDLRLEVPFARSVSEGVAFNPFDGGGQISYFMPDDQIVWSNDPSQVTFHAWITVRPNGKRVGTIRIPHFSMGTPANFKKAVDEFEALVTKMNGETDALILDVLNNSGGMMDYAYALASYFYSKPQKAYDFQYRLLPAFVEEARKTIPELEALKTQAEVETYFEGNHYYGYPVDLDFAREVADFYRGFIEGANAGGKYGPKRHYNAATVKPNPRVQYLKPVFVLADEGSISCGDFFPGFFQDTKRAKIIGRQTAGAGAFVGGTISSKNALGLAMMRIPFAPGFRYDGSMIENNGVHPDVEVRLTNRDFQTGFSDFRKSVFRVVDRDLSAAPGSGWPSH